MVGDRMQGEKNVEQIIGKRIQKIRKSKGYTQQQFAEKIGLSTNYLSDIERGKSSSTRWNARPTTYFPT